MDFNLTKEQKMFQQTLRKLLENKEVEKNSFSRDLWERLAELGTFGLGVSEELGGFGDEYELIQVTAYELGKYLVHSPFYETVTISAQVFGKQEGSVWRKKVEEIISGQKIISFIDKANNIIAEKEDLKHWRIYGKAEVVSFGQIADGFICSASNTLFYVSKDQVTSVDLDFIDNRPVSQIYFENVIVLDQNRLSEVGQSEKILEFPRKLGRLFTSSYMTGASQGALDLAIEYMNTREQFGKTISSFQALSHWAADLQTMSDAALLFTRQLGWEITNGNDTETSILCLKYAAQVYKNCATAVVQMAGGYGFMMEYDMQHYYRNVLGTEQIYEAPQNISVDLRLKDQKEASLLGVTI
ncbi:acyl-CoA dehydrogenase family protein [Neobacillus rhizophilus]|uniref:Acyl-CoA/acyl-ACP dehydrogenase n=1 Tax=Neobacillus rhizophilus TaxID=2833579 RepID=A0A942YXD2_9BACI|nr:acyl-CoA dehydrogenase family protein [Neobacillus rhizophilus]MBS4214965.1 acyl-CoA/acyl-ACP dehydrogenase [Neobacillus rhizophilus]